MLGENRLVTLTGSGGAGKTRLAIEIGATWAPTDVTPHAVASVAPSVSKYPDGVWLVGFAALSEGTLTSDKIASAFGLQAMSHTSEEVLIEHLRDKHLLLILEQL